MSGPEDKEKRKDKEIRRYSEKYQSYMRSKYMFNCLKSN